MSHTPAPWYVDRNEVRGLASGKIATVGGDFYDDGRRDSAGWTFSPPIDTAANARLIAAAPALLKACELLLIYLGDWDDPEDETCVAARQAIAQAKGGE